MLVPTSRLFVNAPVLPFDLPLHGLLGGALGVGIGAFLVTAALAGRDGVVDLARRSTRWRVPVRWYLIALFTVPVGATPISLTIYGSQPLASPVAPRALGEAAAVFVLQLVLIQLAEKIGFTGFSNTFGRTGIHPMKLALYVALLWPCGICPTTSPKRLGSGGADLRRRRSWNATATAPPGPAAIDSWN